MKRHRPEFGIFAYADDITALFVYADKKAEL